MQLEGVIADPGKHRVPGVRKKIPAAFNRPRIDLDGGRSVKRDWRDTAIHQVKKGDTVAGFGTVAETVEFIKAPDLGQSEGDVIWRIRLYNVMNDYRDFPGEHRVLAFTSVRDDD